MIDDTSVGPLPWEDRAPEDGPVEGWGQPVKGTEVGGVSEGYRNDLSQGEDRQVVPDRRSFPPRASSHGGKDPGDTEPGGAEPSALA